MRRRAEPDYRLLAITGALLVFGLVMMYSASAHWAEQTKGDPLYFLKRQAVWALIGLPVLWALSELDYNRLGRASWPILALSLAGLALALASPAVAGVHRWVRLGSMGVQPAEFAKLAMILFLADYLDRKRSSLDSPWHGLAVPWAALGALLGLIALEPDLGTPALMFAVAVLILFTGGVRLRWLSPALLFAAFALVYELGRKPYRLRRLTTFLDPWNDAQGTGYQLVQSLLAVGSGGWLGKGAGSSQLKLMHLPTPHTDFIFPVVCEELGLAGSAAVLGLFACLLVRGVRIARSAPNLLGTLLAGGIVFMISLQAFFNAAMSIGLLPTKGVPLPFFSFGGSSLIANLAGIGILLNISRQAKLQGL